MLEAAPEILSPERHRQQIRASVLAAVGLLNPDHTLFVGGGRVVNSLNLPRCTFCRQAYPAHPAHTRYPGTQQP